ncbi:MAG: hypothetical protein R3E73_05115 [Porticoccaceae bacterium]
MLLPNPGLLIKSLRSSLKSEVLPALEKGAAFRQLKASLHLLERLERSWDLFPQHVQQDNTDLEKTLIDVLEKLVASTDKTSFDDLLQQLKAIPEMNKVVKGINDPVLNLAAQRNFALQNLLEEVQGELDKFESDKKLKNACERSLNELYRRMVARDAIYVGDKPLITEKD